MQVSCQMVRRVPLDSMDESNESSAVRQTVTMSNLDAMERFLTSIYQYQDEDGSSIPRVTRLTHALKHPLMTASALRYLLTFPVVEIALPRPESTLKRWLVGPRRPWRHHGMISSYIALPSELASYWQGTPRQNLRTRTRQARVAGFETRVVATAQIHEVIAEVLRDKGWEGHEVEANLRERDLSRYANSLLCVSVFDQSGHPVAFCVGTQSGEVVQTLWSYTSQRGTARWLCFSGYVEEVSARGGRFIVEDAPWSFTGGNKIFAGHLGFVPARIRRK